MPLFAADPQTYTVDLVKTGNVVLDASLADASTLITLQDSAPVNPFALLERTREDVQRFQTVLQSYGYYKAKVEAYIGSYTLDNPALLDAIKKSPASPPLTLKVEVEPGPLFHIRTVEIDGHLPDVVAISLKKGDAAVAADVLQAGELLEHDLKEHGYALAKVALPIASRVLDENALDISYSVDTGPQVAVGQINVTGLQDMNAGFVKRQIRVESGEIYKTSRLDKVRSDLGSFGVFSSVRIKPAETLDAQGRLPIEIEATERAKHALGFNAAYSTDLGASLGLSWRHRNLFGNAEQLNLSGGVTQLGGNSTIGIGYNALISFVKPDLDAQQSWQADLGAIKQSLNAFDQEAINAAVKLNRTFSGTWSGSLGLGAEQEHISQYNGSADYTLLSLPGALRYNSTNNQLEPTRGIRSDLALTPYVSPLAAGPLAFVVMQLSGSAYFDLVDDGRSVLALRALLGNEQGAVQRQIPADKRFYAGGSNTVRGYKYQSVGPMFPNDKPMGGTSLASATVEFRQRILDDYGAVVFVDSGQVSAEGSPFVGDWRVGTGVGVRYYTAIGPVRLDVAVPLQRYSGSGSFELYLGIGQAF